MPEEGPRETSGEPCRTCGELRDTETAGQKYGQEQYDTFLPDAWKRLEEVRDLGSSSSSRKRKLLRCPTCGTHYRYVTDYEYLANGSEDEQTLTRLGAEEARDLGAPGQRPR